MFLTVPYGFIGPNYRVKFTDPDNVVHTFTYEDVDATTGRFLEGTTEVAKVYRTTSGQPQFMQKNPKRNIMTEGLLIGTELYKLTGFEEITSWISEDFVGDVIRRFGTTSAFSTLQLKRAFEQKGVFLLFKNSMSESQWFDFLLAQNLSLTDPVVLAMLPSVRTLLNSYQMNDTAILDFLTRCLLRE